MPKRKERVDKEADASSSSDESDTQDNIVDVEFEFFDPAEIDFHGIKNLLRQLLDVDATLFDISALTDLIIQQKLLGSTVKVEGKEDDPYAFLTVLNLHEHRVKFSLLPPNCICVRSRVIRSASCTCLDDTTVLSLSIIVHF